LHQIGLAIRAYSDDNEESIVKNWVYQNQDPSGAMPSNHVDLLLYPDFLAPYLDFIHEAASSGVTQGIDQA
jgi:hypothetical protein